MTQPPAAFSQLSRDRIDADADPANIRHLVVIGHPATDSFNHALARAYCEAVAACGQVAVQRDLYALGFDPLLRAHERPGVPGHRISEDVREELELVRSCRSITLVYPIWYGMPPAIITGYVDRVLGAGLGPQSIRDGEPHALLAGKQLVLLTTSGSTLPWLAAQGQWHGLRQAFDYYLSTIFSFEDCAHEHFDAIVSPLQPSYAAECLGLARQRARTTCSALLGEAHERQKHAKLSLFQERAAQ
jgi:NAD(P)H dehydrogenase (quinone)